MGTKIDRRDLGDIVQETARTQRASETTIDREEAQQILRDLDLPAENIDETQQVIAMRRQELAARRQRRLIGGGLLLASAIAVGGAAFYFHARNQLVEQITSAQAALTLDGAGVRQPVARSGAPEIAFEVELARAPLNVQVPLSCEWAGPGGDVRYRNQWTTRTIDRALWPTHCRHRFSAADPAGPWSVTMKQHDRSLATEHFVLE